MPLQETLTVVLAIDGFRASALGAYGATAYETPGFNELAADSTVHEWLYADSTSLRGVYGVFENALSISADRSLLLTDDESLLELGFDSRFNERSSVASLEPTEPAESIGQTALAESFSGFAASLVEHVESIPEGEASLVWLHTKGLKGPWDAPGELVEPMIDEEDPEIEPSVIPPQAVFEDNATSEAVEARFAASVRYAAQVITLDACLAGLSDLLSGLMEGMAWRFVVMGLRGYPLGERGVIGGEDRRLFSEQTHVPMILHTADPADRFQRDKSIGLLSTGVAKSLGADSDSDQQSVVIRSESGAIAARNEGWLMRVPGPDEPVDSEELYLKPDDRWEQNNVASLEPDVVKELTAIAGGR